MKNAGNYIFDYAHSFFGEDFESNARAILVIDIHTIHVLKDDSRGCIKKLC